MKYSINRKMMLGFGVVIVLMIMANVYVIYTSYSISGVTRQTIENEIRAMTLSERLKSIVYNQQQTAHVYFLQRDTSMRSIFLKGSNEFYSAMDSLFFTITAPNPEGIETLHRIQGLHSWYDSVVVAQKARRPSARLALAQADSLSMLHKLFDNLIRIQQRAIDNRVAAVESSTSSSTKLGLILTIGTFLIALALGWFIPRTITKPIDILIRGLERIGRGKFKPIYVKSRDEIALLSRAVNDLSGRLKESNEIRAEVTQQILHEIRSPLGTILSAHFLLSSSGPSGKERTPEEVRDLLNAIRDSVDKVSRISHQLLEIARVDAGMMEYRLTGVNIGEVVESAINDSRLQATHKRLTLTSDIRTTAVLAADPEKLSVVFGNLLSNAVKYTGDGGRVRVTARDMGGRVRVIVADSGRGIDAIDLPHIFNRFYTARHVESGGAGKSMGIGLALVKAYVEGHGGKISVRSASGRGSAFMVDLPVKLAQTDQGGQPGLGGREKRVPRSASRGGGELPGSAV